MKTCTKCHSEKSLDSFHKCVANIGGLRHACKPCCASEAKKYRSENIEKCAANNKAWQKANPDKCSAASAKYNATHLDRVAARHKKYRDESGDKCASSAKAYQVKNKDKIAAKNKNLYDANPQKYWVRCATYRKENRGKIAAVGAKRNAAKLQATPIWHDHKAIEFFYAVAARCTKATGTSYHVDHVVPLNGKDVCGLHVHYNLQILTASENCSKGNRHKVL